MALIFTARSPSSSGRDRPGTCRRLLQRVRKISGSSAADHLGDAWQARFAADDAVGTGASVAIGRAVVSRSVLRKSPADFLADAFDLLGGVLTEGYIASVRRDVEAKSPIQDQGTATLRMTVSNKVRRPLKERLKAYTFPEPAVPGARRHRTCPLSGVSRPLSKVTAPQRFFRRLMQIPTRTPTSFSGRTSRLLGLPGTSPCHPTGALINGSKLKSLCAHHLTPSNN